MPNKLTHCVLNALTQFEKAISQLTFACVFLSRRLLCYRMVSLQNMKFLMKLYFVFRKRFKLNTTSKLEFKRPVTLSALFFLLGFGLKIKQKLLLFCWIRRIARQTVIVLNRVHLHDCVQNGWRKLLNQLR